MNSTFSIENVTHISSTVRSSEVPFIKDRGAIAILSLLSLVEPLPLSLAYKYPYIDHRQIKNHGKL